MDLQALVLAKKYADNLSLGFTTITDLGGGVVRFALTSGDYLDVTVPTVKGDKGDTGEPGADGEDGVSPTVETSKTGGVATVTITDKLGDHTFTINDGIASISLEVVTELPATGDAGTIYLVSKEDTSQDDVYDEYIYVNDNWELIGNTSVDLSEYAKTADLTTVANRVTELEANEIITLTASESESGVYMIPSKQLQKGNDYYVKPANGTVCILSIINDGSCSLTGIESQGSIKTEGTYDELENKIYITNLITKNFQIAERDKGLSTNDYTDEEKNKLASIGLATTENAGLVKPDGTTITIEDGVISAANAGGDSLLLKLEWISGFSVGDGPRSEIFRPNESVEIPPEGDGFSSIVIDDCEPYIGNIDIKSDGTFILSYVETFELTSWLYCRYGYILTEDNITDKIISKGGRVGDFFINADEDTYSENFVTEDALATVATSGSYNDLSDKPSIPAQYELPTASDTTLGGVKVDNDTVTIDANGVISASGGLQYEVKGEI